jgi:hypothetical protein
MTDATYQFRRSLRAAEQTYTVTDEIVTGPFGSVPLSDIIAVRVYTVPGMRSLAYGTLTPASRWCSILCRDGRKMVLVNLHFLGLGRFEDRSATYVPFVRAVIGNVAARYPQTPVLAGMPPSWWWSWFLTFAVLAFALSALVLLTGIGMALDGELTWSTAGVVLVFAILAIGPVRYVRWLWQHRPHPLDPTSYTI